MKKTGNRKGKKMPRKPMSGVYKPINQSIDQSVKLL